MKKLSKKSFSSLLTDECRVVGAEEAKRILAGNGGTPTAV
jgi:hypothetical protein